MNLNECTLHGEQALKFGIKSTIEEHFFGIF